MATKPWNTRRRPPYSIEGFHSPESPWLFAGKERTVGNVRKCQPLRAKSWSIEMTTRSRTGNGSLQAFLPDQGRRSAAAARPYEVITDEEMIEGLSFPCFRRVGTLMMVPGAAPRHSAMEMISISSVDLSDAQREDASALNDNPVDLDKHRGMAAQRATDIRRVLADVRSQRKNAARPPGRRLKSSCFPCRLPRGPKPRQRPATF